MAAVKLNKEQRWIVLGMVAADYSNAVIRQRLEKLNAAGEAIDWDRDDEPERFPVVGDSALSHYRAKYAADIERLRKERLDKALSSGLAVKAERIARLCEHADELELVKWQVSTNGRCWNEKAWRETLDDIAREMGERRPLEDGNGGEEVVKVYVGIDYDKV